MQVVNRRCLKLRRRGTHTSKRPRQVKFQSIDINGEGILDAFELSAGLCDSGLTDTEIEALFFKLDCNSDNQVNALLAIKYYQTCSS